MNKDILEGNKLIAEFMELPLYEYYGGVLYSDLKYHSSWDWLMPVVEKIEGLKLKYKMTVNIIGNACFIESENHNRMDLEVTNYRSPNINKIQTVWKSVIQFIELYNTQ